MEKLMLRPEAAASEEERELPLRDILFSAVSLAALMASETEAAPIAGLSATGAAFILAFMTEEDAHEQTIDLIFLSLLCIAFLIMSIFENRVYDFACGLFGGMLFFGSLRLLFSFWMTCRAGDIADSPALPEKDDGSEESETVRMGYVPFFMLVFVLYLGFGTEWASFIFREASMAVEIVDELVAYFPWIFLLVIAFYLLLTSWEVFRLYNKKPVIYAFGGGDVLFLGLFAGHLGGGPLMALFFLSLLAQAFIMGIRGALKKNSFHINKAQCKNRNGEREGS